MACKTLAAIVQESAYHGLNFCQGTISEHLENPAVEIFDVIRIFWHARETFQRALSQHSRPS
jgi:D-mannonate dehydratase